MKTKERILSVALGLFNAQGSKAVSTNHIAKAANISPGNLYYHFKNKEEIISLLFDQMEEEYTCQHEAVEQGPESLESLEQHFSQMIEMQWKYLFLTQELPTLITQDEPLKTKFQASQEQRLAEIALSVAGAEEKGVLRVLKEEERQALSLTLWLTGLYWSPFMASRGREITKEVIAEGVKLLFFQLQPYLIL